ncbi:MAG TPA: HPr kinase/phosphatase C-terminal domain-containing protein [Geminicoccaceae bacterium]|nr:HPr kinase/phosphatase C-terminal domain-containing protein [Geminicoccus sp.]HMU49609.1 HPr kinase/phosphatase C-terminal domain-containing protein [Geminicoccaceae bacterium]
MTAGLSATIHASCVSWHERGVLLAGPSGAGKSDLALRLIEAGAVLVADDLVAVSRDGKGLRARPVALPGLIELRGQGIYRMAYRPETPLDLCVRLGTDLPDRLPEPGATFTLLDAEIPAIDLDPRLPSAVARLRLAVCGTRVH